jgi:hypothetical protein
MLHAEERNQQPVPAPQNTPQADSGESKSKSNRGGKRAGAGRKPNLATRSPQPFRTWMWGRTEELRLLDKITSKLNPAASDASPNAPQNQIESKPAIEAEVMASGA